MSTLPKVVAFGGGHGMAATLRALKLLTDQVTAVVTVADDGGSSGRLRGEFDCLPPGDLRMALAALCGDDTDGRLWADVLQTRFRGDGPLGGHSVGNLLIAALWQRNPDPVVGLDHVGRLLNAQGRVLPMSTTPLHIRAEVRGADPEDRQALSIVEGQHNVAVTEGVVESIALSPGDPPACQEALRSVQDADYLVFGPGSWFTSVVPHLLVPQLRQSILDSKAAKICVMNLADVDETEGYSLSEHLDILVRHCPGLDFDAVIADPRFADRDPRLAELVASLGGRLLVDDVGLRDGSARHDPFLLASALADVMGL